MSAAIYQFGFEPPAIALSGVTVGSTGQATITGTSAFSTLDQSAATVSIFYDVSTNGFHGTLITRLRGEFRAIGEIFSRRGLHTL